MSSNIIHEIKDGLKTEKCLDVDALLFDQLAIADNPSAQEASSVDQPASNFFFSFDQTTSDLPLQTESTTATQPLGVATTTAATVAQTSVEPAQTRTPVSNDQGIDQPEVLVTNDQGNDQLVQSQIQLLQLTSMALYVQLRQRIFNMARHNEETASQNRMLRHRLEMARRNVEMSQHNEILGQQAGMSRRNRSYSILRQNKLIKGIMKLNTDLDKEEDQKKVENIKAQITKLQEDLAIEAGDQNLVNFHEPKIIKYYKNRKQKRRVNYS